MMLLVWSFQFLNHFILGSFILISNHCWSDNQNENTFMLCMLSYSTCENIIQRSHRGDYELMNHVPARASHAVVNEVFCIVLFFHHTKHISSKHQFFLKITVKVSKRSVSPKICCKWDFLLLVTLFQTVLLVHVIFTVCMQAFSKSSVRLSFVLFVRTVLLEQWTFKQILNLILMIKKAKNDIIHCMIYYDNFWWICCYFLQLGYLQMSYARTT